MSNYQETPAERMQSLIALVAVIGDLCNPEANLHAVNRDKLAMALNWIQNEMQSTLENQSAQSATQT